mgnify:CR=1 FL=1
MADKKVCPLLRQACIESRCHLFNKILTRCDISLVAYNLYRLSEALAKAKSLQDEASPALTKETSSDLFTDRPLI